MRRSALTDSMNQLFASSAPHAEGEAAPGSPGRGPLAHGGTTDRLTVGGASSSRRRLTCVQYSRHCRGSPSQARTNAMVTFRVGSRFPAAALCTVLVA